MLKKMNHQSLRNIVSASMHNRYRLASLLCCAPLAFNLLLGETLSPKAGLWITILFFLGLLQASRVFYYHNHATRHRHSIRYEFWIKSWLLMVTLEAIGIGSIGYVYLDNNNDPSTAALLLTIIVAVSSSANLYTHIYKPAIMLFLAGIYTPFLLSILIYSDHHFSLLGLMTVICAMINVQQGLFLHQRAKRAIHLRDHNAYLVEQLSHQKTIVNRERKLVAETNRQQTLFFASASHDLRQPLHALGLYLDTLAHKSGDPAVQRTIREMHKAIKAFRTLFNNIVEISRMEYDKQTIRPKLVKLEELLNNLIPEYQIQAQLKGLQLRWSTRDEWAYCDPLIVERILRNYLHNAIAHTSDGGVLVTLRRKRHKILIQVWDTGSGIDAENLDKVFLQFYQVSSSEKHDGEAQGLGLAIVKALADSAGYGIGVKSRPGRGSCFSLHLYADTRMRRLPANFETSLNN